MSLVHKADDSFSRKSAVFGICDLEAQDSMDDSVRRHNAEGLRSCRIPRISSSSSSSSYEYYCSVAQARADGTRCAEWLGGLPACMPGLDTQRNTDTKSRAV